MKATCDREKLLHAFQMAQGVAPTRSPKPILQNVKLEATLDETTLLATDLDVGIRVDVPGFQVEAPGTVVLPIGRFGSILRENSDEKLQLDGDGSKVRVRGDRSEFHLPIENPDEFPSITPFQAEKYHKVGARFFRELVRRTVFATDAESSRFALGGVLLELVGEQITAVATDGRRMARQQGPAQAVAGHESREKAIVPTRSMQLLERVLADNEDEILLSAGDNDLVVKSQRTTVCTRLVEGRFPKWRDVFPRIDQMTRMEFTVGPFYSAVRQAAIVTSETHRGVDFTFADGKMVVAARGAELGESRVELPIGYDGPELSLTLDPRFLSDFLRVLDAEAVFNFFVRDAESAAMAETSDGYSYVIMPLARD